MAKAIDGKIFSEFRSTDTAIKPFTNILDDEEMLGVEGLD